MRAMLMRMNKSRLETPLHPLSSSAARARIGHLTIFRIVLSGLLP